MRGMGTMSRDYDYNKPHPPGGRQARRLEKRRDHVRILLMRLVGGLVIAGLIFFSLRN